MRRLSEITGLNVERHTARQVDEERWQVAGYATDDALAELDRRGLTVEVEVDADTRERDLRELFEQMRRAEDEQAET